MSSRVQKLAAAYRAHLTVPWQMGLAAIQRVVFAVYNKTDELRLRANVEESGPDTVVALLGVGTLFGLARVATVVEGIKESITGRLLVFFPGEHHPEHHSYRLLDARDGWNYLAVPLLA